MSRGAQGRDGSDRRGVVMWNAGSGKSTVASGNSCLCTDSPILPSKLPYNLRC